VDREVEGWPLCCFHTWELKATVDANTINNTIKNSTSPTRKRREGMEFLW
jgi:hypothetical protein